MNVPAKVEQVPALALEQSLKTLWLPEWLQRSVNGLTVGSTAVTREDGVRAMMPVPTIRKSLAPSPQVRAVLSDRVDELDRSLTAIDIDMAMAKVTELLLSFAGQQMNEAGAKARARGYLTALEDLPAWAIAEACRRWLRGDAGEQNYNFSPSPPVLRKIAEQVTNLVRAQRDSLVRLLSAYVIEDPVEYSDEHCTEMRARLQTLFSPQKTEPAQQEAAE